MRKQSFRLLSLLLASTFVAITSCTEGVVESIKSGMGIDTSDDYVTNINLEVEDFEYVKDNATRTQLVLSTDGLQFKWKTGDNIGVVPVKGYYDTYQNLEFTVDMDNTDGRTAKFVNGGFMLKKDMSYAAYYPYSYETQFPYFDINYIPVSYRGQRQRYNYNTDHLGKYDYMAAAPVKSNDGSLTFNFQHFGTICHFHLTLPEIADNTKLKTMYISFMNSSNQTVKIPAVGLICDISSIGDLILHYNSEFDELMDNCLKVELSDVLPMSKTVDLFAMMPSYLFNGSIEENPTKMEVTLVDVTNGCHTCFIDMPAKRDYSGKVLSFVNDQVYKTVATSRAELSGKAFNDAIKKYVNPNGIKKVVFETDADFDFGGYEISFPNSNSIFQIKAHYDMNDLSLIVSTDAKSIALSDGFSMFKDFSSMTEIEGLPILNTRNMSSAANMFTNCSSLQTLDLSTFDNKNVHIFEEMFDGCTNLTDLTWNEKFIQTSKNVRFKRMFKNCRNLKAIDFSLFKQTINVADSLTEMFYSCDKITQLDISRFNTAEVVDMASMFFACKSLKLDENAFANWNTANVRSMYGMFSYCQSLDALNLNSFYTPKVENMSHMFWQCYYLDKVHMKNIDTSSLINCSAMFWDCNFITEIDLQNGTFDKVKSFSSMFCRTWSLNWIDISNMAIDPNLGYNYICYMFDRCGDSHNKTIILASKKMKSLFEDSDFRENTGFKSNNFIISYFEH